MCEVFLVKTRGLDFLGAEPVQTLRKFATCTVVCYWLQEVWKQGVRASCVMYRSCKNFVKFGQSVECLNEAQTEFWTHKVTWIPFKEEKSAEKKPRERQRKFVIKFYVVGGSVSVQLSNSCGQICRFFFSQLHRASWCYQIFFIRPTIAQLNCFKIFKFTLKFTINAPTCFGLTKPSSGRL